MHIYYLLEKQTAVQPAIILIMVPLYNYGNGKTNSSATSFNMKNCSTQKKSCDKRGLGQKNHAVKKLHQIHDEKHAMCAWDH